MSARKPAALAPTATNAARIKRMGEKRARFLRLLRETGNATKSYEGAGLGRETVYGWRREDPEFAAQWEAAIEAGTDALEEEALRRAHNGSDVLLIFMLKSRRPNTYRERVSMEHTGHVSHGIDVNLVPVERDPSGRLVVIEDEYDGPALVAGEAQEVDDGE